MPRTSKKHILTAFVTVLAVNLWGAQPSDAFTVTDLRKLDASSFTNDHWTAKPTKERVILACTNCSVTTALDIQIRRVDDGTEGRIRSGQTTAASMFDICKNNAKKTGSTCISLKEANHKNAVGFVSSTDLFNNTFTSTYVIWQNGYILIMRAIAADQKEATSIGKKAFQNLLPQLAS